MWNASEFPALNTRIPLVEPTKLWRDFCPSRTPHKIAGIFAPSLLHRWPQPRTLVRIRVNSSGPASCLGPRAETFGSRMTTLVLAVSGPASYGFTLRMWSWSLHRMQVLPILQYRNPNSPCPLCGIAGGYNWTPPTTAQSSQKGAPRQRAHRLPAKPKAAAKPPCAVLGVI